MKKKNRNKTTRRSHDENNNRRYEGGGSGGGSSSKKIIEDPRFSSVHSDPRFQKLPKRESKVVIDSRFNRMFTDRNFATSSAHLDKRGKPKKQNSETSLRRYYRIDEEEVEKKKKKKKKKKKEVLVSNEHYKEEELEEESGSESEKLEKQDRVASVTGSSSESESLESEDDADTGESQSTTDEEDDEFVYEEDIPEVEVENIPIIEDSTHKLAVVNMDWRHVRAVDLYVVLRSFLPKSGEILSVAVYPSEFGLQCMKEEEVHGPVGLFDDENEEKGSDNDDEIDNEKLRDYEKSRLRYYYAVVECDSVATAEHLYKSCDGIEFERSSNVLDLRFIPDSMEFKHPPRDVAKEAPTSYDGLDFHTRALQHSNVPISWDEDEPQRAKTLKRKFNADQLAELELMEFLASDESETDNDESNDPAEDQSDKKNKRRDKYLALLQSGDGSDGESEEEGQDMEVTFNADLENISKRILEKKDKKSKSVWEETLRKIREKKKARKNKSKQSSEEESSDTDQEQIGQPDDFFVEEPSVKKSNNKDAQGKSNSKEKQLQDTDKEGAASIAELELLLADDKGADNGLKGYNLKPKKSKCKKGKEVPDEDKVPTIDYNDPRFSALFSSPLFALDPTDPQFKRSAAHARQMSQRQRQGDQPELVEVEPKKQPAKAELPSDDPDRNPDEHMKSDVPLKKEKHELSSLVRSIKMKSMKAQWPSKEEKTKKKDEKLQSRATIEMEKPEISTLVQSVKRKAKVSAKMK